jgi:hypothetical protein
MIGKALCSATGMLLCCVVLNSCTESDSVNGPVGGTVLDQGQVGTTATLSPAWNGVTNAGATVVSVANGVSSIEIKAVVTDPVIKAIALLQSAYCTVSGDTVKGTFDARITDEGIQLVAGGKNSTIVRFSDGVGTVYTSEVSGRTHTIVSKSTTDDYSYGFLLLKVSKVEETISVGGSNVKVYFYANHKFGLVGIELRLEDGTILKSNLL